MDWYFVALIGNLLTDLFQCKGRCMNTFGKTKIAVVTGCLGFLGKHLTHALLLQGWKVHGIDKISYCSDVSMLGIFQPFDFQFANVDMRDMKYMPDADVVFSTAASTHVSNSIIDSKPFIEDNVDGLRNILELIKNKPDGRQSHLVHVSTDEVYGDADASFTEGSPLNPSNPYSASKAAGDMLIKAWARTYGISYNIVRPANFYGGFLGFGQFPEKLLPLSVKNLDRGIKIQMHNNGDPFRTWLNVYDAVDAIITVFERGSKNEIYNISGGTEKQNKEVIQLLVNYYFDSERDLDEYVDWQYSRVGQDVRYSMDDSKIRELGWQPAVVFENELKQIVGHLKGNGQW
jgi:dTDP-glucose 4,6-dehydratase